MDHRQEINKLLIKTLTEKFLTKVVRKKNQEPEKTLDALQIVYHNCYKDCKLT